MNASPNMYLVVGLGNPGADYAGTRHNIGFQVVDALAHAYNARAFSKKFHGELAECSIAGKKILLLKPLTYMNNSGRAVQAAMAFYKLPLDQIIVLHDELDLPPGKLRIKKGGGANGQNGVRDIDAMIGPDYWRVRLGIGHPGDKARVTGHVLSSYSKEDRAATDALITALTKHFPLFFEHSPAALMSRVSDEMNPLEKKTKTKPEPADKAAAEK